MKIKLNILVTLTFLSITGVFANQQTTVSFSNTTNHDLIFTSANTKEDGHFRCLRNIDGSAFQRMPYKVIGKKDKQYFDTFTIKPDTVEMFYFKNTNGCKDFNDNEPLFYATRTDKVTGIVDARIMLFKKQHGKMQANLDVYNDNVVYESNFQRSQVLLTLTKKKKE